MKKLLVGIVLVNVLMCVSCCKTEVSKMQTIVSNGMELIVEPGEYWLSKMKIFLFTKNNHPQLAAWIEDDNGNYGCTIAVSEKSAKGNWIAAPKKGRPEALPVWSHRQHHFAEADVVSSATIKDSLEADIDQEALIDRNIYNIYLEINHSFDYNDFWTKDNSGVNGQPSLVYHAQFIAGQSGRVSLIPIGHGSVDGSDGNITSGLENFTSALRIVKNVYINVE